MGSCNRQQLLQKLPLLLGRMLSEAAKSPIPSSLWEKPHGSASNMPPNPPQQVALMLVSVKQHRLWGALFLLSLSFPRLGWWQGKIEEENLMYHCLCHTCSVDSVRTLFLGSVRVVPFLSNKSSPTRYFKANTWSYEFLNTPVARQQYHK